MFEHIYKYFRHLNHRRHVARRKKYMPTRIYKKVEADLNTVADAVVSLQNPFLKVAEIKEVFLRAGAQEGHEVCLFVSYSPKFLIKKHVVEHIKCLHQQGIVVFLVVNVDDINSPVVVVDDVKRMVAGIYCRENYGFDFGAWSQLYSKVVSRLDLKRLYLINDSIVGPLNKSMFDEMIGRIRESSASMVGLTSNNDSMWHLQSFFLVFNQDVLSLESFKNFFSTLWNFPTKELVIFFYELRLTSMVKRMGLSVEALFALDECTFPENNKTIFYPSELYEVGFPYVKGCLVEDERVLGSFKRLGCDIRSFL